MRKRKARQTDAELIEEFKGYGGSAARRHYPRHFTMQEQEKIVWFAKVTASAYVVKERKHCYTEGFVAGYTEQIQQYETVSLQQK